MPAKNQVFGSRDRESGGTEDIRYNYRFVAASGTCRMLARSSLGYAHRQPRQWICYLLSLVAATGVFLLAGLPLSWAVTFALVPTLAFALLVSTIGYVRMLRSFRVRAFEGAVLESGFGDEEMILRNPLSETRVNYRAIKLLTARGEAVFMQQHGVPMGSVYPRKLFPDAEIARVLRR